MAMNNMQKYNSLCIEIPIAAYIFTVYAHVTVHSILLENDARAQ